jgi:DNA-binding transcriptional ArsR family regulator
LFLKFKEIHEKRHLSGTGYGAFEGIEIPGFLCHGSTGRNRGQNLPRRPRARARKEPLHLREIQSQTGFSIGAVRQDVEKLVKLDLVTRRKDGNRVYYAANESHPLTIDIRQMALKTVGLVDMLRQALSDEGIRCAHLCSARWRQAPTGPQAMWISW